MTLGTLASWSAVQIRWIEERHIALLRAEVVEKGLVPFQLRIFGETGVGHIRFCNGYFTDGYMRKLFPEAKIEAVMCVSHPMY